MDAAARESQVHHAEPPPRAPHPRLTWARRERHQCVSAGRNLGAGTGQTRSTRPAATGAGMPLRAAAIGRDLPADALPGPVTGGWRMGGAGTQPAERNVLLVGDAAGLVNPLQGEGIAPAISAGASRRKPSSRRSYAETTPEHHARTIDFRHRPVSECPVRFQARPGRWGVLRVSRGGPAPALRSPARLPDGRPARRRGRGPLRLHDRGPALGCGGLPGRGPDFLHRRPTRTKSAPGRDAAPRILRIACRGSFHR
jgi:hypothetical protein